MVKKLMKLLFLLAILGLVGLVGFAYLGDLSPTPDAKSLTVTLDAD